MTRDTRRTICIIVIIAFIAGVFTFFAVATKGFKNLDGATWFDYWGKGAPATAVVPKAETNTAESSAYSVSARNAAIYHDSEYAESTINVVKHATPEVSFRIGDNNEGVLAISRNGANVESVILSVYYDYGVLKKSTELFYNESGMCYRSYREIIELAGLSYNSYYEIRLNHAASGEFFASDETNFWAYIPAEDKVSCTADFVGTTVSISMPYTYEYFSEQTGANKVHNSLRLIVRPVSDIVTGSVVGLNCDNNNLGALGVDVNYMDYNDLTDTPFTVVDGVDSKIIVDLAQLPFIDSYFGACKIEIHTMASYSWYSAVVFCDLPSEIYFENTKLPAPTDIQFSGGVMSWSSSVESPFGYALFEGEKMLATTDTTSFDFKTLYDFSAGEHIIRVRAVGNVGSSLMANSRAVSPYNVGSTVTQLVALTYDIDGDTVTKFVAKDKPLGDYLYDVKVENKVFGGWYLDSGYSVAADSVAVVRSDMTVYARLSNVEVTERPLTWWEQNMWYVLAPCIALAVIVGVVVFIVVRKKRNG